MVKKGYIFLPTTLSQVNYIVGEYNLLLLDYKLVTNT